MKAINISRTTINWQQLYKATVQKGNKKNANMQ